MTGTGEGERHGPAGGPVIVWILWPGPFIKVWTRREADPGYRHVLAEGSGSRRRRDGQAGPLSPMHGTPGGALQRDRRPWGGVAYGA